MDPYSRVKQQLAAQRILTLWESTKEVQLVSDNEVAPPCSLTELDMRPHTTTRQLIAIVTIIIIFF